jgi:predicted GH43/DUF377 family glycosyl hydrolase
LGVKLLCGGSYTLSETVLFPVTPSQRQGIEDLRLVRFVEDVRNCCIGACLLDKDDPSKVLARTRQPLIEPAQDNRNGYVPNVVYSCGGLVRGRTLFLPYGVANDFATIATADVSDILAAME